MSDQISKLELEVTQFTPPVGHEKAFFMCIVHVTAWINYSVSWREKSLMQPLDLGYFSARLQSPQ